MTPMDRPPPRPGLWREFRYFLLHEKMWWLLPIALVLLVVVVFLVLTANLGDGGFTYDLF